MLRTLRYYWPIHLAVISGAAVATAVLTGALLVGDSVRGSLRDLTLDRLGGIEAALLSQRFVRQDLAVRPASIPGVVVERELPPLERAVPAIVLRGSATHASSGARASRVAIHGVDAGFGELFGVVPPLDFERAAGQTSPSVILNESLRRELGCQVGDSVLLSFGRTSDVPRESLMGDRDPEAVVGSLRLTVSRILPDRGPGRFSLAPTQQVPLNAFVHLPRLQRALDLVGRVNAILTAAPAATANDALARTLGPGDLGLEIRQAADHFAIGSREHVLHPRIDEAVGVVARQLGAPLLRTQSYLANRIRAGSRESPYALIAALDPQNDLAWASLALVDGSPAARPSPDGILLGTWLAQDLDAAVGDRVELTYFVVGPREELREEQATLRVEGIVERQGLAADPGLTPDYPGIQDADDIADWDPPFPVDLGRIRQRDEDYWDAHGATPKAFVAEETGRRLWSTRFGSTSAIRIGGAGADLGATRAAFERELQVRLPASDFGLVFQPVKQQGLEAAAGATDFAGLFVAFSFFLILSAGLLVGLLFRLGVEQRAREIGLLLAVGHRVAQVRSRLIAEGALLASAGGLLGIAGGVGYAGSLMAGLRTLWRPAVGSSELFLHVQPTSLVLGFWIAQVVVVLSIALAVHRLVGIPAPRLLAGATRKAGTSGRGRLTRVLAWGGLLGAAVLAGVAWRTGQLASPALAFGTGSLLLVGGLALFALASRGSGRRALGPGARALTSMAVRNTAWNPGRSILSVSLVATACFVLVVVATHHADPALGLEARTSGSGGFQLVAESDIPLHHDLGRHEDRLELGLSDAASRRLDGAEIFQMRLLPGDDASCLNLYQPDRPRLLGVPDALVARGGFRFQQALDLPPGARSAWDLLERKLEPGVVPAIGDANSVRWILHLGLGQELTIEDDLGRPLRLRVVGLLANSVFQSELLISERDFLEHFPGQSGTAYFLVEAPAERVAEITELMEAALAPFGFDAMTVREKIAAYRTVENTYLATFQVLGGLGLLLGTVGLGVVLARNVIERRGELATLRAIGFRRWRLVALVLAENLFLLVAGLGLGTLAALGAAAPRLAGLHVPWASLLGTLLFVLLVGMLSSVAAVLGTLRVPLLATLKTE